ncbi:MAG: hypothetical protein AB7O60_03320 [Variibacter sp.]
MAEIVDLSKHQEDRAWAACVAAAAKQGKTPTDMMVEAINALAREHGIEPGQLQEDETDD